MKEKPGLLYVTPSVSREIGGIFEVERNLAQELSANGIEVDVVGLEDSNTLADLPKWLPLTPTYYKVWGPAILGFNPNYLGRLMRSKANVGHIHSLWSYTTFALFKWAQKKKRPYVVSPNGMLDEWALKNSKWKKDLALFIGIRKILENAACILVNTDHEYASVRKMGLQTPVSKINNGIRLPDLQKTYPVIWSGVPAAKGKKILLFLSRIHHKKGLHLLLEAWNNLVKAGEAGIDNWHLVAVGFRFTNDPYEQQLITYLNENGLENRISFLPGQYGEDMKNCYAHCDAFTLPSYSEGVPIAVLEAWAFSKPVVMTKECNLAEGFDRNAAIEIRPEVTSIEEGLRRLTAYSSENLQAIGKNGRQLAEDSFSWNAVAKEVLAVYNWSLNGGEVPASFYRDTV